MTVQREGRQRTMLYKALDANGRSCNGGNSKWSLPKLQPDGTYKPGRWMPAVKDVVPCERGYHLFERKDLLSWVNVTLYEAEGRGAMIDHGDKVVYESARLLRPLPGCNERVLRLFACRCAEDVLPIYEGRYPRDDRPRKALETARRYAIGGATEEERSAARAAAREAAGGTAGAAAWGAAGAAAWGAAQAAAQAAAREAAQAAAREAAGAAWAAAGAAEAARAAAGAAWAAAGAAAGAKYTDWLWEMIDADQA